MRALEVGESGRVLDPGVGETGDLRLGLVVREYGVLGLGLVAREVLGDSLDDCRRGRSASAASVVEYRRGDPPLSDICCDSRLLSSKPVKREPPSGFPQPKGSHTIIMEARQGSQRTQVHYFTRCEIGTRVEM
jgi:hypothetical protein